MTSSALPYLSVARVSGPDAESFLQAQLSADIAGVANGACTFACYCSPRGQVFGLLLVCRTPNDFLLVGSASLLPGMLQRLRLYVLRAKVELAMDSGLAVWGVDGAEAAETDVYRPAGGDLAYRVQPSGELPADGAEGWKARELQGGVAWLEPETTERFIPQMLGFDRLGAVSFRKGCYPGQEIVARARYLGRVKRGPQRLVVAAGPIPAGATVSLHAGDESLDATVVDSVAAAGTVAGIADGCLVLVVAPELPGPVDSLGYDGRSYRCATM